MKKSIYASLLWFIGVFAFASTEQCEARTTEESHIHEMTLYVATENLHLYNDEIMVVVGEQVFPVKALERSGNQWRVQVVSSGYCPMGHNLCRNCNLCHLSHCIYYVRPCKLWD